MKKLILVNLMLLLLSWSINAQIASLPSGDGSEETPYQIANLENLYWIGATDAVVTTPTRAVRLAAHYIQTSDIEASTTGGWVPIGNTWDNPFTGNYNGNGKTISGLYIPDSPSSVVFGLFGYAMGATFQNIGLPNVNVNGAHGSAGGLVGYSEGVTINNCYSSGTVTAHISGEIEAGGLVGYFSASSAMFNCYSTCDVSGANIVGGLAGINYKSTISDSHYMNGTVTSLKAENTYCGGLVGDNDGSISKCYSTGTVNGFYYTGGLVGRNNWGGQISNSFSRCTCSNDPDWGSYGGGLVGANWFSATITNCYSPGKVTSTLMAGLVGVGFGPTLNSFWNADVAESGTDWSDGGTDINTTAMKTQSTFENAGWDFATIWGINSGINDGYPYLVPASVCTNGTIALSSGSNNQTVSANTLITPIVYTVGGGASGASISPTLPDGLSGTYNSDEMTFTIYGTPTAAGTYNYTVTTTGTASPCTEATATGSITVTPDCPNPPAITLGGAEPVCSEQVSIYLPYSDLINFNPADGNMLIAWDSPDFVDFNYNGPASEHFAYIGGGVGSVITIRIPEDVSGTYTGTITLTNASGCISSAYQFTATINEPLPKPTIEVIEGSTEICEDGSVTFKAIGAEGSQYRWYQGGYEISKGQTFSKEFGYPGEPTQYYTYEVTQALSDEIGNPLCESERASIIVTHSRKPYGGNIQTIDKMCTGTTKSVTWYNAPDEGGTYKSSNTDVATVDQNGLVTAILAGTADISYSLTGTGACSSALVTSTEKFDVYENNAEITGNNSPVCDGDAAKFYINAPANRIIYYKLNDVEQAPIGTNEIIANGGFLEVKEFSGSVTLTLGSIEYPYYCTKELTQSSTVIENPIPVTFVSPQTSEIAEGASVTLTASGADSYSWSSVPAGFSSTDALVIVTPLKNTTYIVTGTSNGCSSSDEAIIYVRESCKNSADQYEPNNSMSGNLFSIPTDLTISANLLNSKDPDWYKLEISSLAKYTLTCQKTNTNTGSPSVELYGSNGRKLKSIDRTQPNSYNLSIGTYYIKVSAGVKTYLCYTLQVVNDGTAVGAIASFDDLKSAKIIEPIPDGIFRIWPNPTRNEFDLYNGTENPVKIRVFDAVGRTIEMIENVGIAQTVVFGSKYKPGIYFVETFENGAQKVFKLVKQ